MSANKGRLKSFVATSVDQLNFLLLVSLRTFYLKVKTRTNKALAADNKGATTICAALQLAKHFLCLTNYVQKYLRFAV